MRHDRGSAESGDRILSKTEVAVRLFLNSRTVGCRLDNVHPKLGISARTELTALNRAGNPMSHQGAADLYLPDGADDGPPVPV